MIWKPEEIRKIIKEDEYEELRQDEEIMPGDIAIYIHAGDVEHSGIVVSGGSVPIIVSKWGQSHEVVHQVNDCPYTGTVAYYRIKT